jgi:formate-dependent nitrite reductase cytochrome c552 subunit
LETSVQFAPFAAVSSRLVVLAGFHRNRRLPLALGTAVLASLGLFLGIVKHSAQAEPPAKKHAKENPKGAAAEKRPEGEPAVKKLVKPKDWPAGHPLPTVGSNCASCHLTAGRELTAAVVNFARSAHDLSDMTCYDCHGGNSVDDVKAHGEAFGFIGTKKSAHIERCSECHSEAAEVLAAGPHGWDFSKRINTEYPLCFDCHGNHDIGNPQADFKLAAMCGDCHDKFDKQFPQIASVVKENDRLWEVLRNVRKRNVDQAQPVPTQFREQLESLRERTMRTIHTAKEVSAAEAKGLNDAAESLRNSLQMWLQSAK